MILCIILKFCCATMLFWVLSEICFSCIVLPFEALFLFFERVVPSFDTLATLFKGLASSFDGLTSCFERAPSLFDGLPTPFDSSTTRFKGVPTAFEALTSRFDRTPTPFDNQPKGVNALISPSVERYFQWASDAFLNLASLFVYRGFCPCDPDLLFILT